MVSLPVIEGTDGWGIPLLYAWGLAGFYLGPATIPSSRLLFGLDPVFGRPPQNKRRGRVVNNQVLDLNPSLAERAKASENARKSVFHERVLELAKTFAIKETARLLRVSTGYLRTHAEQHQVTFADRDSRTVAQKREVKKLWSHYMIQFALPQTVGEVRTVRPGDLKITPNHSAAGRKALLERQNAFLQRACELAEVFTLAEASEILGVSYRYLKNFAYNWEVTFVGMPSFDVKNAFYDRTAALAAIGRDGMDAARELNVTPRFLLRYSKAWELSFTGLEQFDEDDVDGCADVNCVDDEAMDDFDEQVDVLPLVASKAKQKSAGRKRVASAPRKATTRRSNSKSKQRPADLQFLASIAWTGKKRWEPVHATEHLPQVGMASAINILETLVAPSASMIKVNRATLDSVSRARSRVVTTNGTFPPLQSTDLSEFEQLGWHGGEGKPGFRTRVHGGRQEALASSSELDFPMHPSVEEWRSSRGERAMLADSSNRPGAPPSRLLVGQPAVAGRLLEVPPWDSSLGVGHRFHAREMERSASLLNLGGSNSSILVGWGQSHHLDLAHTRSVSPLTLVLRRASLR